MGKGSGKVLGFLYIIEEVDNRRKIKSVIIN